MKDSLTDRLMLSNPAQWLQRMRHWLHYGGITSVTMVAILGVGQAPIASQEAVGNPATSAGSSSSASPASQSGRPILQLGSQGERVTELQALLKLLGYYTGAVDGVYQASTANAVSAFQQAVGLQSDGIAGIETWNRLLPAASPSNSSTAATPAPAATTGNAFPTPTRSPAPATAPAAQPRTTAPTNATPRPANAAPTRPTTPAPNNAGSSSVQLPILRLGAEGPAVERLQERLQAAGFYNGAIDGVFGPTTEASVQDAQRRFNLEPDGVVGPATWSALLR